MGQRSGSHCNGAIFHEISKDTISGKIHCTVLQLDETLLKSSLVIYDYVEVQQLEDICETQR